MDIKNMLEKRASVFQESSNNLYRVLDDLGERLIILDLSDKFGVTLKSGLNTLEHSEIVEEVRIEGCIFNLINRSKGEYKAYVLYFDKPYNIPYLGFMYKGEIVSPHIDGQISQILEKYNDRDLSELLFEVDKRIDAIDKDLIYLNSINELGEHKFYYRNYDGIVEGQERFDDIDDVIKNFRYIQKV